MRSLVRILPGPYIFAMHLFVRKIRYWNCVDSFPKQQILDSPKLHELAGDNFEFYENDGKYSKRIENTVKKGESPRIEPFTHSVF